MLGAGLGLLGLGAATVWNGKLTRDREEAQRRHEARAVAAAIRGELKSLKDNFDTILAA